MDPVTILIWTIVGIFLLLLARGMFLVGTGSDAELQAREMTSGNAIGDSGWGVLEWLRTTNFAPVVYLEYRLGLRDFDTGEEGDEE